MREMDIREMDMRKPDVVEAVTKDELIKCFCSLGIQNGSVLEVHSSLSSFGYVEGGADTVIEALIASVGEEGSIFMPALRLSPGLPLTEEDRSVGITSKIKILPEDRDRSAMGVIADTFRKRSDTVTGDGIMQIAGWGKHAQEAVKGGLDYVIKNNGMALLLGVDIYKLTAMHYVENCMPKEIGDIFAPSDEVNAVYPQEEWFVEQGEPPVKAWYTIQRKAYEQGMIRDGYIGSCKYMYFNVNDVISIYERELRERPFALYGVKVDES